MWSQEKQTTFQINHSLCDTSTPITSAQQQDNEEHDCFSPPLGLKMPQIQLSLSHTGLA